MSAPPRELSPPVRLAAFGAGLLVVLGAAVGVGRLTGDVAEADPAVEEHAAGADHGSGHSGDASGIGHGAAASAATSLGTTLTDGDLRLDVPTTTVPTGRVTPFSFRVLDASGPVREYDVEQGKRMHLVVVARDLSRFAHLHPEMGADGTWTVPLTLSAGSYRAVADFSTDGRRRSLAVDLVAPGPLAVAPLPAPATVATVDDLRVELRRDGAQLAFTAYRTLTDAPVVPEPYLGARGHLVAFRAGDLAYAHVHPAGEAGPTTTYEAELPGPGTYRLFLELRVDGVVRTFPFTLVESA